MMFIFYLHDGVITDCMVFRVSMEAQQQMRMLQNKNGLYDEMQQMMNLKRGAHDYVSNHSIMMQNTQISIERSNGGCTIACVGEAPIMGLIHENKMISQKIQVKNTNPAEFIRKYHALKKWGQS